jgi:hypothetical protein
MSGENNIAVNSTEDLVTSIFAEHRTNEVGRILEAWRRLFGITLDAERVNLHLKKLAKWQSTR